MPIAQGKRAGLSCNQKLPCRYHKTNGASIEPSGLVALEPEAVLGPDLARMQAAPNCEVVAGIARDLHKASVAEIVDGTPGGAVEEASGSAAEAAVAPIAVEETALCGQPAAGARAMTQSAKVSSSDNEKRAQPRKRLRR